MHRLAQWHAPALFLTPEHLCLITFKAMMPACYPSWSNKKVQVRSGDFRLQSVASSINEQTWQL